jgi:hypothetical protein
MDGVVMSEGVGGSVGADLAALIADIASSEAERDAALALVGQLQGQLDEAHEVLREVADMWTGRDAFMPVAVHRQNE